MRRLLAVLACCATLGASACNTTNTDNVLVRYEGGVLTREDVAAHLKGLKRSSRFRDKSEMLTPEFAFDHALNMEMVIAAGLAEKLHLDPVIRNELHQQMSDLFLRIMEEKLVTPIDRNSVTDEDLRHYYEAHIEEYQDKPRYTLRAFSVAPAQSGEVASAIRAGELSYAEAAAQYAQEEEARNSGGLTGTRTLRRFQATWQPVVEALQVGEVTGPIQIDNKEYILLLERRTEARQYTFEEKKNYIRNDVLYSRYRDAWQQKYDELRQRFAVRIDQKKLADFYREAGMAKEPGDMKEERQ